MPLKIQLRAYQAFGPHGDRDREKHEYFDYASVLIREDGGELPLHRFDGFDFFHTTINRPEEVKADAEEYTAEIAAFLGIERLPDQRLRRIPPKPQPEWESF